MNAGRELDAVIAEKVFRQTVARGWVIDPGYGDPCYVTDEVNTWERDDATEDWIMATASGAAGVIPPYSTDMGAAWTVVMQMIEQGWHFDCNYYPDDLSWVIVFWKPGMTFGETTVSGITYTAPQGICLAALKVLGVHVDATHA